MDSRKNYILHKIAKSNYYWFDFSNLNKYLYRQYLFKSYWLRCINKLIYLFIYYKIIIFLKITSAVTVIQNYCKLFNIFRGFIQFIILESTLAL